MIHAPADFPIAIIGAGFSGIGAAIRLKQAGIESFTIFERAAEIGGTWRDNTYPGAACDVPSHVYSLSFEQNPNWTRSYASGDEIQSYLLRLVDKWGLRHHLRASTPIVEASFDADRGVWTLTTGSGERHEARVVLAGVGGLVDPATPEVPGLDTFEGERFHTARWRHDVELRGKRVAVIGTGASAVQVVPSIAPQVERLSVFQRTPSWVVARFDRPYSERARRLFARFPLLLRSSRFLTYWLGELRGPVVFLRSPLSLVGRWASMWHLRRQVSDPELRRRLTPTIEFGCKRVLVSNDYWATFERDNVELVTDPIAKIVPRGLVTGDGAVHEVDVIVMATGFQVGFARVPLRIVGLDGKTLAEAWADGAVAYKGTTISGFPNLFLMMGPNTGPGHTSVLVFVEAQIAHALAAIEKMRRENLRYLNVKRDVLERYNAGIQGRMKYMAWSAGCDSWYLAADGTNRALYPGFAAEYVWRTRRLDPGDYEGS